MQIYVTSRQRLINLKKKKVREDRIRSVFYKKTKQTLTEWSGEEESERFLLNSKFSKAKNIIHKLK